MLKNLLFPNSIAVIGASKHLKKVGHSIAKNILSCGYKGRVFFINQNKEKILGKKSYGSMEELKSKVDLAIVAIPAQAVPAVLESCGKKGIKNAIIVSAGFSETGEAGKQLEDEIISIAEKCGMKILGPNCLGILNSENNLNASFAAGMIKEGNTAFISQSGAICSALLDWAALMDFGFSQYVSIGNAAMLDEADLLSYYQNEPSTKVIMFYLEGFKNGREFLRIAQKISLVKPIIFLKGGIGAKGIKAVGSHTGAIAGDGRVIEAALKKAHIIQANTLEDFFLLSLMFSWQPIIHGNKVAIVSNAGGLAVLAADAVEKSSLELAHFSSSTIHALQNSLPSAAAAQNPVDIVGDADAERYRSALLAVLKDRGVDAAIILLTPQSVTEIEKTAHNIASIQKAVKKPVVACFVGGKKVSRGVKILQKNRIPVVGYPNKAIDMLNAVATYVSRKTAKIGRGEEQKYKKVFNDLELYKNFKETMKNNKTNGISQLGYEDYSKILYQYEIGFVPSVHVSAENELDAKIQKLSFPLVAKIDSPDVLHKSDAGGVQFNIEDEEQAHKAFGEIVKNIKEKYPSAKINGVIFQEMVTDSLEVIIGAKRDKQFGPCVLFGMGGVYVEIFKDVSLRLSPVSMSDARSMVEEVKFFPILEGARGQEGYDINALVDVINKISQLMIDFEEIQEIDLNPIMVAHGKGGVKVVDCKIIV